MILVACLSMTSSEKPIFVPLPLQIKRHSGRLIPRHFLKLRRCENILFKTHPQIQKCPSKIRPKPQRREYLSVTAIRMDALISVSIVPVP